MKGGGSVSFRLGLVSASIPILTPVFGAYRVRHRVEIIAAVLARDLAHSRVTNGVNNRCGNGGERRAQLLVPRLAVFCAVGVVGASGRELFLRERGR